MHYAKFKPWLEGATIFGICAIAIALRISRLDRGLWEDECVEYALGAARPLWGSFTYQPFPLYHLLSHLALYFSDREWVIRVPSLIAGISGIGVLYFVTRKLFGVAAAVVAALMFCFSTFHISVSTEARFYALTMLMALLLLWTLHRATTIGRSRDWFWYAVAGNLAGISQLMMLPILLSMAGGAALWSIADDRLNKRSWRPRLWRLVAATVASFLGVAIAAGAGGYDLSRFLASDSNETAAVTALDDLGNPISIGHEIRLLPSDYLGYLEDYLETPSGTAKWLLIGCALAGLFVLARKHASAFAPVIAAIVIPPLPFFFINVTHFYHPRYFCAVLPLLLLLIAGGLAAVSQASYRTARRARLPKAAAAFAAAVPPLIFALEYVPLSAGALARTYEEDFTRGLHFEFAHDQTMQFLAQAAAPKDYASMCVPRPDWNYYYRRHLAERLVAPVEREASFSLWYVGGMANCVDQNEIPAGAVLSQTVSKDWLGSRKIYRYELVADEIRSVLTLDDFEASASEVRIVNDGDTVRLDTQAVAALPHRYVEFVVMASGPPQYVLSLKFTDETGRFLQSKSFRMRDKQTQREPHPTGDAPPVEPSTEPYRIKFATVTPPLTAKIGAEIVIEGDTRAGDSYKLMSADVRGDWAELPARAEINLPTFDAADSWTYQETTVSGVRNSYMPGEAEFTIDAGETASFRIESPIVETGAAVSLEVEIPFSGSVGFLHPSVHFFDAEGNFLERTQFTAEPVYEWWSTRNMLVRSGEGDWSSLFATLRVPGGAASSRLVLDSDDEALVEARNSNAALRLMSPRLHGLK